MPGPTYDGNEGGDGKADRCGSNLWTCFPHQPGEEQECGAKLIMIRYIVQCDHHHYQGHYLILGSVIQPSRGL